MRERTIGAFILVGSIGIAVPGLAEAPSAAGAPVGVSVPAAKWEGAACAADGDCRSHHCADSWDGTHYCARADLSCAFPASSGVIPGFSTSSYGITYTCQAGGDWQQTGHRSSTGAAEPAASPAASVRAKRPATDDVATASAGAVPPPPRSYPKSEPYSKIQTTPSFMPTVPAPQPVRFQPSWRIKFW